MVQTASDSKVHPNRNELEGDLSHVDEGRERLQRLLLLLLLVDLYEASLEE